MSTIQIRKAQREGARLIIGLGGVSGCGKTFTAIQLAYGLANGVGSKVGLLDTENRRGSLYADEATYNAVQQSLGLAQPPEPFLVGDLFAPFTPQRYIEAIHEFQAAGVEVLVIDSATHEYEGTGGCIEIAEAGNPKMPNWNKAKAEHKRFMNAVLQCNMHIVFCVRAREKATPERVDGKIVYKELGLQPIQEKNFMFEMTASLMLHDQGTWQDVLKCPAMLQPLLGRGEGYITAADGKAVRAWVDGAKQLDQKLESWKNRLISQTEQGLAHTRECWEKTPEAVRNLLGEGFMKMLEKSASEHDRLRADAEASAGDQGSTVVVSTANRQGPASAAAALSQSAAAGRQAASQAPKQAPAPQNPLRETTASPEQYESGSNTGARNVGAPESAAGEQVGGDVF